MSAMRVTTHSARKGKDGVFSAKHNDRNFSINNADHINPERSKLNRYWQLYEEDMTFENAEQAFYEETFQDALDAQNGRHLARRQPGRVRTMEQYRKAYKTCPEEELRYIGSKKDGTVDPDLLWEVVCRQLDWEEKRFPQVQVLDIALHMDEGGAPHIHERKVWIAHDRDGNLCVGQAAALEEMGVPLPHPEKKPGRYNNRKQTYSAECREHFMEICREYGLEIIDKPREASKSGLELTEYKARQEAEKASQAREEARQARQEAEEAHQAVQAARRQETNLEVQTKYLAESCAELEGDKLNLEQQIADLGGESGLRTIYEYAKKHTRLLREAAVTPKDRRRFKDLCEAIEAGKPLPVDTQMREWHGMLLPAFGEEPLRWKMPNGFWHTPRYEVDPKRLRHDVDIDDSLESKIEAAAEGSGRQSFYIQTGTVIGKGDRISRVTDECTDWWIQPKYRPDFPLPPEKSLPEDLREVLQDDRKVIAAIAKIRQPDLNKQQTALDTTRY